MQLSIDFSAPSPLQTARLHADQFTSEFLAYLPDNLHVWSAFEREAFNVIRKGRTHYSARTIIEVLRHNSALSEDPAGGFKLNDWHTPYLSRLFGLMYPHHADLFERRVAKAAIGARAAVGAPA
jgi:hypothetical protein